LGCSEIIKGVWQVGSPDWDRRLFDELIPLPDGTTYNSYLVRGSEKSALIDTVDPPKAQELLENLRETGLEKLDFVVSNHVEQDHSGSIPAVLSHFPEALVVANEKCRKMLVDHLHLPESRFLVVQDRETLPLGDKTLEFIFAPWVHWPETMLTYLREEAVLFPCDFLGSHLAQSSLYVEDEAHLLRSAKRYYAEIMMPFRSSIRRHLELLNQYPVRMIAPSHGPVHNRPDLILPAYREWISDEVKNEVVLPYVSMHGSTGRMAAHLVDALIRRGITVHPFNLTGTDTGELAMALVDAATIVLGTPTVLTGPHPQAVQAAYLANALRPKTRFASVICSYGWGSRAVEQITGMLSNLKVELLPPVQVLGAPEKKDFEALDALADKILEKHREQNIYRGK
jgi:flavorubredoxin